MFTGIIEATARVLKMENGRLIIERPKTFDDLKIGSSIAVSGVCLSAIHFDDASMSFDVVDETLSKTKFGSLKKEDAVNLERSMRADGRFEGHVVQGHVEGVARVIEDSPLPAGGGAGGGGSSLTIELPHTLLPFVVQKGSITIDGVSLTVAKLNGNTCTVALIPHTLKITTLGNLQKSDSVNIETDILARYSLPSHS